jgi:hypothetical protein
MGPDPDIFVTDLQAPDKKLILYKGVLLITFGRYIYIIFQRIKVKKSHKTVGIKVFLLFLHDDRRIPIRIQEAQKHTDLTDLDPQHWS